VQASRFRGSAAILGPALFIVLFAAVLVATALVVRAKTPDLIVEVTHLPKQFTPNGDGRHDVAAIRFFVRDDQSAAKVSIVGHDLEPIRTLDPSATLGKDRPVTYRWNGRMNDGARAPLGRYRLRVELTDPDRDVVFPRRVDIVG
jgi:hypothetical protein